MPGQTIFFDEIIGGTQVEVLKSHDEALDRESIEQMDNHALAFPAHSLSFGNSIDVNGPNSADPDNADFGMS